MYVHPYFSKEIVGANAPVHAMLSTPLNVKVKPSSADTGPWAGSEIVDIVSVTFVVGAAMVNVYV